MRYKLIIFDFDGTLADTAEGIFESIRYAMDKLRLPPADAQTLAKFIGPPLDYSFRTYIGLSEEEAEQAVVYYRENYAAGGKYKLYFYPGIIELVHKLRNAGASVAIASAKPMLFVRQILDHYHVTECFDEVQGAPMREQSADKSCIIRHVIERCGNPPKDTILMVGDTRFDVQGAKKIGVAGMGVLYGYGTEEEMQAEGADYLVHSPEEIWNILSKL